MHTVNKSNNTIITVAAWA